jgi:5-methylcytosine-specific restriction endonuclease McrA
MPHWYCAKHIDQEADYLATRERWARGHDASYQRKYNKVTRNRNESKSKQYQFYRSRTWQSLRRQAMDRDMHMDQYALLSGAIVQGNTVDHIVPAEVAPELMNDPSNLVTCSPATHRAKTKWEREYYGTGQGNQLTGAPWIRDIHKLPIKF